MTYHTLLKTTGVAALLSLAAGSVAQAQTHIGNVTIDGSLCVGFDCTVGMGFGFDTIVLKENNVRIFFDDTSTAAAFPRNDWAFQANDSTNGGGSYMALVDRTTSRQVFRVDAAARTNALYVDSQGDLGLGTSTPAVDIDIKTGNTPTVRLQQDGTSGFTPQTWDMAGNEANFFIRDATNGSQLPLRIRPGADSDSILIDADNDIGMGTASPDADLEISTGENFTFFRLTATGAAPNTAADMTFTDGGASGFFRINIVDGDAQEFSIDHDGNLTISGNLVTGGGGTCDPGPCDAVFDPAVYTVPSIEDHAALMWDNKYLPAVGPTLPGAPVNVTIKLTRMLNELEHAHIYIEELNAQQKQQTAYFAAEIDALKAQLAAQ